MNKKIFKYILINFFFVGLCFTLKPIDETTAKTGAIVGGLVLGGISTTATYSLGFGPNSNLMKRLLVSILVGACVGGATSYKIYKELHSLTPAAQITAAEDIVKSVITDFLISKQFNTVDDVIACAAPTFRTSSCVDPGLNQHIKTISDLLFTAQNIVDNAEEKTVGKVEYQQLYSQAQQLTKQIKKLSDEVASISTIFSDHSEFSKIQLICKRSATDLLLSKRFHSIDEVIAYITTRFSRGWPLVEAGEYLIETHNLLLAGLEKLNKSSLRVQKNALDNMYNLWCTQLKQNLMDVFNIVESNLTIITMNDKYDFQMKLYEKRQESNLQQTLRLKPHGDYSF